MSRLTGLPREQLDGERLALFDDIVASRGAGGSFTLVTDDGCLVGPFNAMVHAPALGRHWSALGARLRFESVLDQRLVELAICTVGAHFRAEFELYAHGPLARAAGVAESVVDALRRGDQPTFVRDDERLIHDLSRRLVAAEPVPDALYAAGATAFGEPGMVELASLIGYYAALAIGLNLFAVGVPPDYASSATDTI